MAPQGLKELTKPSAKTSKQVVKLAIGAMISLLLFMPNAAQANDVFSIIETTSTPISPRPPARTPGGRKGSGEIFSRGYNLSLVGLPYKVKPAQKVGTVTVIPNLSERQPCKHSN